MSIIFIAIVFRGIIVHIIGRKMKEYKNNKVYKLFKWTELK